MTQEIRNQESETDATESRTIRMDKMTLCNCISNFQNLLHQASLCGRVLASINNNIKHIHIMRTQRYVCIRAYSVVVHILTFVFWLFCNCREAAMSHRSDWALSTFL